MGSRGLLHGHQHWRMFVRHSLSWREVWTHVVLSWNTGWTSAAPSNLWMSSWVKSSPTSSNSSATLSSILESCSHVRVVRQSICISNLKRCCNSLMQCKLELRTAAKVTEDALAALCGACKKRLSRNMLRVPSRGLRSGWRKYNQPVKRSAKRYMPSLKTLGSKVDVAFFCRRWNNTPQQRCRRSWTRGAAFWRPG